MEHKIIKAKNRKEELLLSIILYTDIHPHIIKCLRDSDYWTALDKLSGSKWIIFAVKPKQGEYGYPKSKPGIMQMMCPIWKEPDDNKELIEFLGIDNTLCLPLILFLKIKNNKLKEDIIIEDQTMFKIEGSTEQEIYNNLQSIIDKVSKSIEKDGELFENAKSTIKREKRLRIIKKSTKILADFNSLIPGIF